MTSYVEYGALTGPLFLFPYGLFLPVSGYIADRISRPKEFLLIWAIVRNFATLVLGFASSFPTLLFPRVLFAISSCALDPVAFMAIAAYFPQNKRGIAMWSFLLSIYIGAALAALSIIVLSYLGWRFTFGLYGVFGILVTILAGWLLEITP